MGDPATGAQRLSMAGGINNLGTTIGPLIVSFVIFGSANANASADISSIKAPYLVLGVLFIVIAAIFKFSSLPNKIEQATNVDEAAAQAAHHDVARRQRHPLVRAERRDPARGQQEPGLRRCGR